MKVQQSKRRSFIIFLVVMGLLMVPASIAQHSLQGIFIYLVLLAATVSYMKNVKE